MYFTLPSHLVSKELKILVIGAGGNGSIMATQLAKMNNSLRAISDNVVGLNVTIADNDTVSQYNIGRQNFYPSDIGKNKAKVLVERFNLFFGTQWKYNDYAIKPDDSLHFYDIIITCVDSPVFRYELGEHWKNKKKVKTLWLDMGVSQHTGQVILGHLSQAIEYALPNIHSLYGDMLNNTQHSESSCSTEMALQSQDWGVNDKASIESSQILWQLIRHGKVSYVGQYFDIQTGESSPMKAVFTNKSEIVC